MALRVKTWLCLMSCHPGQAQGQGQGQERAPEPKKGRLRVKTRFFAREMGG